MELPKTKGPARKTNFESETREIEGTSNRVVLLALARQIYKNPARAATRELMCNAADAHKLNGTKKRVDVTLPNYKNKTLCIRDYGPGMTEEEVNNHFLKIGNSSKTKNNEQTGSWGIGRLSATLVSPVVMVKNFNNGVKTTYNWYENEGGVLELKKLSSEKTEETGLEISMGVDLNQHEVGDFINGAEDCRYNDIKFSCLKYKSQPMMKGKSWIVHNSSERLLDVVMCGLAYRIQKEDLPENFSAVVSMTIFVEPGSCTIPPNRDGLVFDKKTKDRISGAIDLANKEIRERLDKELESKKDELDRERYIEQNEKLLRGFFPDSKRRSRSGFFSLSLESKRLIGDSLKTQHSTNSVNPLKLSGSVVILKDKKVTRIRDRIVQACLETGMNRVFIIDNPMLFYRECKRIVTDPSRYKVFNLSEIEPPKKEKVKRKKKKDGKYFLLPLRRLKQEMSYHSSSSRTIYIRDMCDVIEHPPEKSPVIHMIAFRIPVPTYNTKQWLSRYKKDIVICREKDGIPKGCFLACSANIESRIKESEKMIRLLDQFRSSVQGYSDVFESFDRKGYLPDHLRRWYNLWKENREYKTGSVIGNHPISRHIRSAIAEQHPLLLRNPSKEDIIEMYMKMEKLNGKS